MDKLYDQSGNILSNKDIKQGDKIYYKTDKWSSFEPALFIDQYHIPTIMIPHELIDDPEWETPYELTRGDLIWTYYYLDRL